MKGIVLRGTRLQAPCFRSLVGAGTEGNRKRNRGVDNFVAEAIWPYAMILVPRVHRKSLGTMKPNVSLSV